MQKDGIKEMVFEGATIYDVTEQGHLEILDKDRESMAIISSEKWVCARIYKLQD